MNKRSRSVGDIETMLIPHLENVSRAAIYRAFFSLQTDDFDCIPGILDKVENYD